MYESEAWTISKAHEKKINTLEIWCLQQMGRISWKDMKTNEEQRTEYDLKNNLFKALVEANPFDVPQTLVDEQRKSPLMRASTLILKAGIRFSFCSVYIHLYHTVIAMAFLSYLT